LAETLDVRLVRAASLEPLHETAQVRLGIGPNQQVEVRRHHAYLKHVSALLASNAPEIVAEEGRYLGIEQRQATAGSPDDVVVETVSHAIYHEKASHERPTKNTRAALKARTAEFFVRG
jgi:hypothetical protein